MGRIIGASGDKLGHHRRPDLVEECHDWLRSDNPKPSICLLTQFGRR